LARKAQGQLRFVDTSHIKVHQDASNPAGGQQNQAIGRTKGGLNTKLSAWVDSQGQPVSLSLAPGQAADVNIAQGAARPPLRRTTTVADKGYDSDEFRAQLRRWGSQACIPPRCNRLQPASWHRGHYRKRHKVENLFQRLKRNRRVGTRYEKNDLYFLAFVQLAAILDWLKN
jgi:transposase